jgi:hypothetical protein
MTTRSAWLEAEILDLEPTLPSPLLLQSAFQGQN